MKKFVFPFLILLLAFSCTKETAINKQTDAINQEIKNTIIKNKALFDWNQQSTDFIYKAIQAGEDKCVTIGYTTDFRSTNELLKESIQKAAEIAAGSSRDQLLVEANDKLGILKIRIRDQKTLEAIRNLNGVEFVEPTNFAYDREFFISDEAIESSFQSRKNIYQRINNANPGEFDPNTSSISYDQYMESVDGGDARMMRNQNLTYVYDSLKKFSGLEVAILDNGVLADRVPYFQVGNPTFSSEGYHCANPRGCVNFDGPNPRNYDLGGLSPMISGLFEHGTQQADKVYNIMPKGPIKTVRSAQWVFLIFQTDMNSVTRSILAMADNPTVKVISMSQGTIFVNNEMKRAVQYFVSKDKIFVSAAGTFLPIPALKDLIGVIFPANMPETVATTGIQDIRDTNGEFVLGEESTTGPETDFVVENGSSSPTVSATAGMFGLIWGINPNLTATQIRDIFVRSSTFYINNNGQKHPVFGWGKVDCKLAAKMVEATL